MSETVSRRGGAKRSGDIPPQHEEQLAAARARTQEKIAIHEAAKEAEILRIRYQGEQRHRNVKLFKSQAEIISGGTASAFCVIKCLMRDAVQRGQIDENALVVELIDWAVSQGLDSLSWFDERIELFTPEADL
ncbi:hypothetical protein [Acetobacter sicerae]|uniref:hypothetical protein n=1 Tax=Acetobacter sicerae TaxID=85325 RepID=UPI00156B1582|nr:hypothetical protein [Acetobacter sicerae]NHN92319.1 hypothetical protein [Acetobacter sicerae]